MLLPTEVFAVQPPCQSGPQKSPIPAAESQQLKATTGGRNGARLRAGKQAPGSSPQAVPQAVLSSPYLKQGKEAGTNDADRRPHEQGRDGSQERTR